jgi:hypothetical protein
MLNASSAFRIPLNRFPRGLSGSQLLLAPAGASRCALLSAWVADWRDLTRGYVLTPSEEFPDIHADRAEMLRGSKPSKQASLNRHSQPCGLMVVVALRLPRSDRTLRRPLSLNGPAPARLGGTRGDAPGAGLLSQRFCFGAFRFGVLSSIAHIASEAALSTTNAHH